MTYTITRNPKFDSLEITFDGKPCDAVREALKGLRFRWHSVKKCWYGFAQEHEAVNAILSASPAEDDAAVMTDGYLGGGAVYGSKSNLPLYGTDLAKAIRADLKTAGIKGVTIASKHGNIQATITTTAADVVPEAEFISSYRVTGAFGWVDYTDENGMHKTVHITDYFDLPADLQERIRIECARREYARDYAHQNSVNHYHLDKYTGFSAEGHRRIEKVISIISAYRYDESNSMVDYFSTNFYFDIYTKPSFQTEEVRHA